MNAPTTPRRWDYHSGVTECATCEGKGAIWNGRGNGGCDPDSWDVPCADCNEQGHHDCPVCGFGIEIGGYDCLVCFVTSELPTKLLTDETADAIHASLRSAIRAASVGTVSAPVSGAEIHGRDARWLARAGVR